MYPELRLHNTCYMAPETAMPQVPDLAMGFLWFSVDVFDFMIQHSFLMWKSCRSVLRRGMDTESSSELSQSHFLLVVVRVEEKPTKPMKICQVLKLLEKV